MTTDDLIAIGPWVHVHKVHTGMASAMTQDHGVDVDSTEGDVPPSKEVGLPYCWDPLYRLLL